MKPSRKLAAAVLTVTFLAALSACAKEGPAEQAGERIDDATESLGEKLQDTGEAIEDAAEGGEK